MYSDSAAEYTICRIFKPIQKKLFGGLFISHSYNQW